MDLGVAAFGSLIFVERLAADRAGDLHGLLRLDELAVPRGAVFLRVLFVFLRAVLTAEVNFALALWQLDERRLFRRLAADGARGFELFFLGVFAGGEAFSNDQQSKAQREDEPTRFHGEAPDERVG